MRSADYHFLYVRPVLKKRHLYRFMRLTGTMPVLHTVLAYPHVFEKAAETPVALNIKAFREKHYVN